MPLPFGTTRTQAIVVGIAVGTFTLLLLAVATGFSDMGPDLLLTLTLTLGASVVIAFSPGSVRRKTCATGCEAGTPSEPAP